MLPERPRRIIALTAAFAYAAAPAWALVRWNEGKDQVFVTAQVSVTRDSNVYTSADAIADTIYATSLGLEYRRHAGLIGVNADFGVSQSEFSENPEEGFSNPSGRLEFTKDTGRTTGSLSLAAARSSRADPAANLRTDSWSYSAEALAKYSVSERHNLALGVSWRELDYINNPGLVDLTTIVMSADWFYVFTSERDLFAGYRLRLSETSAFSEYADHGFSVGVSGRILPKLNGTARVGYQLREGTGATTDSYEGYSAAISATWNLTKRASITGRVNKDFNTTSTNVTTDTLAFGLDAQYARTAKLAFAAGAGYGETEFLGTLGGGRSDTYVSAYAIIRYTFSERLRLGLSYDYFNNWSTEALSDFDRHLISFDASSRF